MRILSDLIFTIKNQLAPSNEQYLEHLCGQHSQEIYEINDDLLKK